jgi:hypothetical protein
MTAPCRGGVVGAQMLANHVSIRARCDATSNDQGRRVDSRRQNRRPLTRARHADPQIEDGLMSFTLSTAVSNVPAMLMTLVQNHLVEFLALGLVHVHDDHAAGRARRAGEMLLCKRLIDDRDRAFIRSARPPQGGKIPGSVTSVSEQHGRSGEWEVFSVELVSF